MNSGILLRWTAVAVMALSVTAAMANETSIKERMKERKPVIDELKAGGVAGETWEGLLAFVGEERVKEDIVAAENKDRQTVYHAIARETGTTALLVGKRRAIRLFELAAPGERLQGENGVWLQKE